MYQGTFLACLGVLKKYGSSIVSLQSDLLKVYTKEASKAQSDWFFVEGKKAIEAGNPPGKEATGGTTPYEMKDSRDTWYSKHRVKAEDGGAPHTGGIVLSSHAYGDNLKGYNEWTKPEFARQPIIRDSFFRSTGVLRGQ